MSEREELIYELRAVAEDHSADWTGEMLLKAAAMLEEDGAKQDPVASIYITPTGEREMDDWRCELPAGRYHLYPSPVYLYAAPVAQQPLTQEQIKEAAGASDNHWATSKLFIVAMFRAAEQAHGIGGKHD